MNTKIAVAVMFVVLTGLSVLFGLVGAYGSAAFLINTAVSQLVKRTIIIHQPSGYLKNNEQNHNACMLVAAHENVMEWHCYFSD